MLSGERRKTRPYKIHLTCLLSDVNNPSNATQHGMRANNVNLANMMRIINAENGKYSISIFKWSPRLLLS